MRLNHAASLMKEKGVSYLIVIRKDVPIGIVTEKDLVEKSVAANAKPSHITIKDIMSSPLLTVQPGVDIADAARTMASLKIRRLVVVEDSRLVGILTESDILRISPALIEITREFESINRERDKIKDAIYTMGICENCQSFSEELREYNGLHICKFCAEDTEQD
jgi:predicted transcriptional regulator